MFGRLRAEVRSLVGEVRQMVETRSRDAEQRLEQLARAIQVDRERSAQLLARIEALEARRGADPELVKEVATFNAEVAILRAEQRKLRGKLYKDPEFHQPKPREEQVEPEAAEPLLLGGAGWGALESGVPR